MVPPESTEYLRIVEGEVQRSKRIVDRLLEFSRPKPLAPEQVVAVIAAGRARRGR